MERLTKLPLIGPVFAWIFRTRAWRVYEHLDARKWDRIAAAITYASFLGLFPMLVVGAAIAASFLSPDRMRDFKETLADQVPGISDKLDIQSLADHAGTVGLIAGAALLVTGVNWAGTLRECLRAVWDLEEDPGNWFLLKAKDLAVLIGLGIAGLVSMAGSAFAVSAVDWTAERIGLPDGGIGTWVLRIAGYVAAVGADFLLLWYVLQVLPRVDPSRRAMVEACLIGAVGFELLKLLLGGYLQEVAAKNTYGAFGVPVALLLWIGFMTRLLLWCAGWTATHRHGGPGETTGLGLSGDSDGADGADGADSSGSSDSTDGSGSADGSDASDASDVATPSPRHRRPDDAAAGPGPGAASGGAPRTPPSPAPPDSPR